MLLIGGRDRLLDDLRLEQFVVAQRDLVVLAGQQHEDVDIVVARLRAVDQPSGAGALAQRVIDILGIVGEHPEGAVAAHHSGGACEALHQHAGHFLLAGGGAIVRALRRHLVNVIDRAEADGARVDHIGNELLAVLARLSLVGRDLVDAEILVVERVAGDLAVVVDQPGQHLDQDRLAGSRRAVADEGEEEAAELHERVQLAVEIMRHQHLGKLHRLVLGDVVADDLVRLLETHHQLGALLAGRDVEAVEREIVGLDADMRIFEGAESVEAALARQQPLDRRPREALCPDRKVGVALGAGKGAVQPGDQRLQRVLRRVEQEVGFLDIVRRLAIRLNELQQVGCEAEGRNVSRRRQEFLEDRGILAFERCARIARLQAFQVGAFRKGRRDGQRNRDAAPRPVEQRVLRDRHQLVVGTDGCDCLAEFDLAGAPHRAGRDRRDEAAAGASQLGVRATGRILQHDDARDHRLRGCPMLVDIGFGNRGQAGVHVSFLRLIRRAARDAPDAQTSLITCPFDRMWTL